MNAEEYRLTCKQPNAFPRAVLEATLRALPDNGDLGATLREILEAQPLSKPFLHKGSEETDYFLVEADRIGADEARDIADLLSEAEAASVGENGETTSLASHVSSLVDKWNGYVEFLESRNQGGY